MIRGITIVFIAVFGFSIVGVMDSIMTQDAVAQSVPERRLLISPLRREIVVSAGTVYQGFVTLKNTGSTTLNVDLSAQEFSTTNAQYDYAFLPESPINSWVKFNQERVIINPGDSLKSNFIISVPNNSEPGGKYLSIFAAAQPSAISGISSTDRVGSLIYMNIPGNSTKNGTLLKLNSPFIVTDEINWSAAIRSTGTTHFRSNYVVTTRTLLNQTTHQTKDSMLILPATVRLINGSEPQPEWLGIYKVSYTFALGDNPSVTTEKWVLYAPVQQTISIIFIVMVLIFSTINLKKIFLKRKIKSNS